MKLIQQVFRWCIDGIGANTICARLHKQCPAGLRGTGWHPSCINQILRSRSVLGEYQPHTGSCAKRGGTKSTRKPFSEPIQGYFPAIVSEADFYRAQKAMDGRRKSGGRTTGTPNLFSGLLTDATDGQSLIMNGIHGKRILVSSGAIRKFKGSKFCSIDYQTFERAILSQLAELKPSDVVAKPVGVEDTVAAWTGKLIVINRKIEDLQKHAADAEDVIVFVPLLNDLARQRKEAIACLDQAKMESASREGDALGESQSLLRLLEDAEEDERDDLRRRFRTALRRLVEKIYVLIVPKGRDRRIAVQLWFKDGKHHRDYLILHEPTKGNATTRIEGEWVCRSLASVAKPGDLDLRCKEDAAALAESLPLIDVEALD